MLTMTIRRHNQPYLPVAVAAAAILLPLPMSHAAITTTGDVSPDPTTTTADDDLRIGDTGDGSMTVDGSSGVTSFNSYLGFSPTASGEVTVEGAGAWYQNDGTLVVGAGGTGTLNIMAGNVRVGRDLILAQSDSSTGTVNLTGGTLHMQGNDIVFGQGNATFNFLGGGMVDVGTFESSINQQGGWLEGNGYSGLTTIAGDYTLGEGAYLGLWDHINDGELELQRLAVEGHALLEGVLDLPSLVIHKPKEPKGLSPSKLKGIRLQFGDSFDILTATTIDASGLTLYRPGDFRFDIIDGDFQQTLRVTVIPEPASVAFLGAGGLMLLRRRR